MAETAKAPRKLSILVIILPPIWAFAFALAGWGVTAVFDLSDLLQATSLGTLLSVMGFAIAASGRLTFVLKGAEIHPTSPVNSVLVTTGPFRFSRNPKYIGIFVLLTGAAFLVGAIPAFLSAAAAFFLFVNLISILFEKEKIDSRFGDA